MQADVYNPHLLVMKRWVSIAMCIIVVILLVAIIGSSIDSPPMYAFDDSEEQKVCPNNYLNSLLKNPQSLEEAID